MTAEWGRKEVFISCLALAILSGLGYSICKMEGLEWGRPVQRGPSFCSLNSHEPGAS